MSIKVSIGKSFRIPLESSLGSTPLGWCLKKMPEGVVLLYQENIPIRPMNSIQMFNFVATAQIPSDNARLEFVLIDFTTFEEKDTFSVSIETVERTTNKAGKDKFIEITENASANRTSQACNPALDYGVLPNNQFDGACMNRFYDMMSRSAFQGNPACIDMMYYMQPRSAFQENPACIDMMYYVQPRSAFDGNPACIDMMYYMQPRSAFQGNSACTPAVPYGVLPNNQFDGACMNRAYDMMPRSAFDGNPACVDMMYYMQPRSAFQGSSACNPAVPYGVLPNNRFDGACMNREYDIMPRSAFQSNPACIDMMYYMQPRSAFKE